MKIQETTISDQADGQARVEMQISATKDMEPPSDYVVFSVLVSTEPAAPDTRPISFRVLQIRALKEAIALLGRVEDSLRPEQS